MYHPLHSLGYDARDALLVLRTLLVTVLVTELFYKFKLSQLKFSSTLDVFRCFQQVLFVCGFALLAFQGNSEAVVRSGKEFLLIFK